MPFRLLFHNQYCPYHFNYWQHKLLLILTDNILDVIAIERALLHQRQGGKDCHKANFHGILVKSDCQEEQHGLFCNGHHVTWQVSLRQTEIELWEWESEWHNLSWVTSTWECMRMDEVYPQALPLTRMSRESNVIETMHCRSSLVWLAI